MQNVVAYWCKRDDAGIFTMHKFPSWWNNHNNWELFTTEQKAEAEEKWKWKVQIASIKLSTQHKSKKGTARVLFFYFNLKKHTPSPKNLTPSNNKLTDISL